MTPTFRAVLVFLAGLPLSVVPALAGAWLWPAWLAFVAVFAISLLLDALLGLSRRRIRVRSEAPDTMFLGETETLFVEVSAGPEDPEALIEAVADLGEHLAPAPVRTARIEGGRPARFEFPLKPGRRGIRRAETVWLRWTGPLGLVRRTARIHLGREFAVVLNLRAVRGAALRFFTSREFLGGRRSQRYRGTGSEFESLREYTPGLDPRAIHWKASARHAHLICQEFRAERDRRIVLAFDTGRLMDEPMDGIPKLDHAIHAGLLLGYAGLRSGDRVGLFAFDDRVRAYGEPESGVSAFPRLQRLCAGLSGAPVETNFTLGLAELSVRLQRRSLVVLLTDFIDTITAQLMLESLGRLSQRHLVLFVTLRDPSLDALAGGPPSRLSRLYESVVASDFLREREIVLRRLKRLGAHIVDSPPGALSTSLLNRYLDIHQRELLG